jgi:hypothetical protein
MISQTGADQSCRTCFSEEVKSKHSKAGRWMISASSQAFTLFSPFSTARRPGTRCSDVHSSRQRRKNLTSEYVCDVAVRLGVGSRLRSRDLRSLCTFCLFPAYRQTETPDSRPRCDCILIREHCFVHTHYRQKRVQFNTRRRP